MSIVKSSSTNSFKAVGDVISYTFNVTNTGNVDLTGITVADPNATGIACPATSLTVATPTNTMTCTGEHTVTQADLNNASVINTASVSAPNVPATPSNQVTVDAAQTQSIPEPIPTVPNPSVPLPRTGTDTMATLPYAIGLIAAGLTLVLAVRRRRRTTGPAR